MPGSGKTTIMAAARIAWEAAGLTVAGSSTAALAAHHLGTQAGLPQSASVAYWLTLIEHGDGPHGIDVLILDEAAMTDTRDLAALLHHATRTGTKIVEIGDPHQLASPGVGGAFTIQHDLTADPTSPSTAAKPTTSNAKPSNTSATANTNKPSPSGPTADASSSPLPRTKPSSPPSTTGGPTGTTTPTPTTA
ncbi:AAA family ATPase [Spirillospora sp. NPDC052242]